MDSCSFKKHLSKGCQGKRYAYKDHSIEFWKEKLWISEKRYIEEVPADINICHNHSESLRGKYRNELCFNPLEDANHTRRVG